MKHEQPQARVIPFRRPQNAEAARSPRVEVWFAPGWPTVIRPVEREDGDGRRRIEVHYAPGWPAVVLSEDDDVSAAS